MDVRWSELDASLFGDNKCFDFFGCFFVEFMQERFEAAESEPGVAQYARISSSFEQFLMGTEQIALASKM
jgi:hypothetical protein